MEKTLQKVFFFSLVLVLAGSLVFTSCEEEKLSNAKEITSYTISVLVGGQVKDYVGVTPASSSGGEDEAVVDNDEIVVVVPLGTDLTQLRPTIEVSPKAKVTPASRELLDFSAGIVKHVVKAEDGSKKTFLVRVVSIEDEASIGSFRIGEYEATIGGYVGSYDSGNINSETIRLTMPGNRSSLTPVIVISPLATISPASGTAQDFTEPVTYTVTGSSSIKKTYRVVITSDENEITGFKIGDYEGTIGGNTIGIDVPARTQRTSMTPAITISPYAKVSPATGVAQNFNEPVTYTVTAENGDTREYVVTVTAADASPTLSIQLVANAPGANGQITVYGITGAVGNQAAPANQKDYDDPTTTFTISTRVTNNAGDMYNPNLPNTLVISIGAQSDSNVDGSDTVFSTSKQGVYSSIQWYVDGKLYDGTQKLPYTYGYLRNGSSQEITSPSDSGDYSAGQYNGSATGDGQYSRDDWRNQNIVSLDARDYPYTIPHAVTIVAVKDGVALSKTITFRVVR